MSKTIIPKDAAWLFQNPEDIAKTMGGILSNIEARDKRIKYLEEENKKLKDEAFKDEELTNMKEKYESIKKDLMRGFPVSEEEEKRIEEWMKKHDKEVHGITTLDQRLKSGGCIGGRYIYIFVPTSIGIIGTIKCNCGEKFEFRNDLY